MHCALANYIRGLVFVSLDCFFIYDSYLYKRGRNAGRSALGAQIDVLPLPPKKNLMKLHKGKCKILHLGGITPSTWWCSKMPADLKRWFFPSAQYWWSHNWSVGYNLPPFQYKRDLDILKRVQQRDVIVVMGWDHLSYEERLRGLELFRLRGHFTNVYKYLKGGCKEGWLFSVIHPAIGKGAMGTDQNKGGSLCISRKDFLMRGWLSSGTGHWQVVESFVEIFKNHLDMLLGFPA